MLCLCCIHKENDYACTTSMCINLQIGHKCMTQVLVMRMQRHVACCYGCRGLVEYAAPLCYLCADQASCAVLFCTMYARFWCRLHTIDDTAGKHATLVSLCVLFVHLLEVWCQTDQSWEHTRHVGQLCIWILLSCSYPANASVQPQIVLDEHHAHPSTVMLALVRSGS